jgi:hypothetical protein
MTLMTMHSPWTSPTLHNAMVVRQRMAWSDFVNGFALVGRPLVVTLGIIAAAAMWPSPAHADGSSDAAANALNDVGIGNNGPLSTTLAGIGQSICPMLVKPGATVGSTAAELSGHTGLSADIAGWVTSMAIQSQCPSFMTSLANGSVPGPLQTLADSAAPASPFQLPGTNPPASTFPFALPTTATTPAGGLLIPGQ